MTKYGGKTVVVSPTETPIWCPVCGRASAAQPSSAATAGDLSAWGTLINKFYAHGRCPICAIGIRRHKFSSYISARYRRWKGQPEPYVEPAHFWSIEGAVDQRVLDYSPTLPTILSKDRSRFSPKTRTNAAQPSANNSDTEAPFLLEINSSALGIHFRLSLGGGDFNKRLGSALGAVAQHSQRLCVSGAHLAKWAIDRMVESQQTILDPIADASSNKQPEKVSEGSLSDSNWAQEIPGVFVESYSSVSCEDDGGSFEHAQETAIEITEQPRQE